MMKQILVCLLTLVAVSACGFKLKGTHSYDHLSVQNWQITGLVLQSHLQEAMQQNFGKTLDFSGSPEAEIRVLSVDSKKDVYTITRAAKLNEYLLSLRVTAQAFRDGRTWGEPMQINVRRTLPYADSMVLGKDEEEAVIWQEMYHDAAQQIVRRLAFLPDYPSTGVNP